MKRYFVFGLLLSCMISHSQDGNLDLSFNATGRKVFAYSQEQNERNDLGYFIKEQPDGKYVVFASNGSGSARLMRYNHNGTLDSSYGTNGLSDSHEYLDGRCAVMQTDGKVLIAGKYYPGYYFAIGVARYNTDGSVDSSFGSNGMVSIYQPAGTDCYGQAVAIDSSGNIIVAGTVYPKSEAGHLRHHQFVVIRLTSSGLLDTRFNASGSLPGARIVDFGNLDVDVNAVAIQKDGKVVIGGYSQYSLSNTNNAFTLVRLIGEGAGAGTPDASFGKDGIVITYYGFYAELRALAIQDDNKIVAGGLASVSYGSSAANYQFVLTRYLNDGLSDGTPDPTFNSGSSYTGTVITDMGEEDGITSIAISNNKINVAGYSRNPGTNHSAVALARYNTDGTLDNSFDGDGKLLSAFSERDRANSLLVEKDNGIVITGYTSNAAGNIDILIVRYSSAGAVDVSFNANGSHPGVVIAYLPVGRACNITGIAVQPDGKIIVAGYTQEKHSYYDYTLLFALSRLDADGSMDTTFGNGGIATANFGHSNFAQPYSVALNSKTGKIILGGRLTRQIEGRNEFSLALAQFTKEGVLDSSFGSGGMLLSHTGSDIKGIFSIALQEDGKIVAGGRYSNRSGDTGDDFLITRYTASGAVDSSFGSSGTTTIDFMGSYDVLENLVLQKDGKILVAGHAYNPTKGTTEFVLARLTSDGQPDRQFGTNGKLYPAMPGYSAGGYVTIDADNNILASAISDSTKLVVIRYSSSGQLDRKFGEGGLASVDFPGYNMIYVDANSAVVQNDEKIILSTKLEKVGAPTFDSYYGVARFTNSGKPDNTWGNSGRLISEKPYEMNTSLWDNGRLYLGGAVYIPQDAQSIAFIAAHKAGQRLPYVRINDVVVNESAGSANLTVSLDKPGSLPVKIKYATQDNTATSVGPFADYRVARGNVIIPAGTTSATISVDLIADKHQEADESFFVNISLSNPMSREAIIADGVGTVTITELSAVTMRKTRSNLPVEDVIAPGKLVVKVMPNPSTGVFTIEWQSASSTPASIRILDISGRLIESRTGLSPGRSIQVGYHFKPGAYYAEVMQGGEKVVVKLVKQ